MKNVAKIDTKTIAAVIAVLASFGAGYYLVQTRSVNLVVPTKITSFEDCAKAGYPILKTYPEQCKTPDGKIFTKQNTQPPQSGIMGLEAISMKIT